MATRFVGELHTRKLNRYPGDTAFRLMQPAIDVVGNTYGKGSKAQPLCGGYSNDLRANYCEVTFLEVTQ